MSRMNSWKLAALFSVLVMICICLFSPATTHAAVTLAVTGPQAGNVLPAGSTTNITWNSPPVDHYNLYYSLNSGTTWTTVPGGSNLPYLGSSMNYSWTVPMTPTGGNVTTAKIKVVAYNSLNAIVSSAISATFTIQTLKVTSPNGGEIMNPKANPATIAYTMYGSNSAVNTVTISFTTNGGTSWTVIATSPITAPTQSINLYSYPTWTVPAQTALKTACKVKVDIKHGTTLIATDMSDANFTILPFFAISGVATLNAKSLSGVTMSLGGADTGTIVTDINGKYTFKNLLPGNYTVSAAKSLFAFKPAVTDVALTTANFTTANFAATGYTETAHTLSGTVSGATGTNVLVTLTGTTGGTVMTDGGGNYSFANLPTGFYTVTPAKTGYTFSPLSSAGFVNADTTGVNFASATSSGTTFSISGKVTFNTIGLAGTVITVSGASLTLPATVATDALGNYTIKGLKNGTYTLSAGAAGYFFSAVPLKTIAGANLTGVNFAATATGAPFTISGHILSAGTSTFPLPSMTVTLNSSPIKTTKTDTNGFYQFTGVPNGTYTLTPSLAGASTAFYPPNALTTVNGGGASQDFGAQIAYNISGSVSYAGTKKGRIYVGVVSLDGSTRLSTSIGAPGTFMIHGVPPGTYRLTARMDNLGWGTKNVDEPNTTDLHALQVNVTSGNLINQTVPLYDPGAPSAPPTPQGLAVFPGESSALITWQGDYSINTNRYVDQKEMADSYLISWGTDSTLVTSSTITVPAYGQQVFIQTGLSDGAQLYYQISAVDRAFKSPASAVVGPVTIGAAATDNSTTFSVSGTITLPAPVPDSKPLYVGVYGDSGIYFTPLETLASSQSYTYTITGIPNGNYQAFAFVDLLQNDYLNVGAMSMGIDGAAKIPVTINNADATQDIALLAANSLTAAGTNHSTDGTKDRYTLLLGATRQKKLPVKLTLLSGPNVPVPMDIGRDGNGNPGTFSSYIGTGPFRPSAGDTYTFAVTYADNTTETLITPVTAVLDSFAQNMTVDPVPSAVVPTFNWSAPASSPTPTYIYTLQVNDNNSGQVWNSSNSDAIISASTTSVQYNFDNSASLLSLSSDMPYNWQITVNDTVGNSATYQTTYTSGGSIFDISGTISGAVPDGVTVYLMDSAGVVTLATTTTSGGGLYSFPDQAPGTYSVIASLATYTFSPSVSQPVTINDTDLVVNFTETLLATQSVSGQVTYGGIGFPGVTVTAAGTPGSSTTTDANGNYTIAGLLSGYTYTITTSKTNYSFTPANSVQAIGGSDIIGVNFSTAAGSGHTLSGTVNVLGLSGGLGLQGVLLTLDTSPTTTVVTDGGGNFFLSNIPDATYTLTPSFAGTNAKFYPTSLPVTMSNADQPNQNFGARVTFTLSGTVSYPSGTQTGRVYVSVGNNGGWSTGLGTSIPWPSIVSSQTFTIRGVPPGNYSLAAWMDTSSPETGAQLVSSPTGSISSVNISNADITGQTITMADPVSLPTPSAPTNVKAFPGDATAFIMWKPPMDNNGKLLADHFNVYYDTNPVTTLSSHMTVTANGAGDAMAIVSALTNTQVYHFAITAVLGGAESSLSSEATATIGATAGLNGISGTVYYPAAADGKNMIVGVYSDTNGVFFAPIANLLSTSATYSIAGIPDGSYTPFVVIDMNNDNTNDIGDISNTNSNNAFVTVSGGSLATGVDQTLSGANASPRLSTNHSKDSTGSESYSLRNIGVIGNEKLPVQASLTGPNVLGPTDLDTTANGSMLFIDFGTDRPSPGDNYSFSVSYSDASSETLASAVTAVLDSFAQTLTVTPVPNDGTPTFSWTAPVSPPANAAYSLSVFQDMGGTVWEYPQDGVFSQTTVTYNTDGKANPASLAGGTAYGWMVSVADANNNTATLEAPFYTPGSSIFTLSGTVGGAIADGVTMNLSGDLVTSTTTTNGGHYSFTNLSPGSYTVTPSKYGYTFSTGTSQPVTITSTDPAALDFTASVIPTYHISGTVSSAIADGVTVNLSGDLVTSTTTTNGGQYSFSNIADGTYSVVASLATYTFSPTSIPVAISGADSIGNNFTGSPLPTYGISGQVTFNGIGFPGVTVTATGGAGGIATTDANGNYAIPNLLSGQTYTITASEAGYTFSSPSAQFLSADITGVNFIAATGTGYNISGTVYLNTFGGSTWLPGVLLSLDTSPTVTAVTDVSGNYTISNIPNGNYTLTPSLAGAESAFYPASILLTVNNGGINENFSANVFYTVSGIVSSSSGSTGRVYVVLQMNGGGTTGLGTSIPDLASSPTFTIRGVPPGDYSLAAWMDTSSPETGVINAASPLGGTAGFSVTNADVISPDIVISDPTPTSPLPAPQSVKVTGRGSNTALIKWKPNLDTNGNQFADHYSIYYATGTVSKSSSKLTVSATSDNSGHVFVSGLTNASTYNFAVTASLNGQESVLSSPTSTTINATTGLNTVSGTISFPSSTLTTGKTMYVILDSKTNGTEHIFFTPVTLPSTSPASYSIAGVPNGTYTPIAVIDMNGDGAIDLGDIGNTNGNNSSVTVSGNLSGVNQTLSGANAFANVSTSHFKDYNSNESYSLQQIQVSGNVKLPVAATLTSGPNTPVPLDLEAGQQGYLYINLGSVRPTVGDSYAFAVAYSDGTSETLNATVTAVLDNFATNLNATNVDTPTFTWTAPSPLPTNFNSYNIFVGQNNGGFVWNYPQNGTLTTTSVLYNVDGSASQSALSTGVTYQWQIGVNDLNGNSATIEAPLFTAP